MTGLFMYRTGSVSHVGRVRTLNEDSVLARPDIGLWAVADGMGGHGGGDVASRSVVAELARLAPQPSAAALLGEFEASIVRVNGELRALARARGASVLGTTLVAVPISPASGAATAASISCAAALSSKSRAITPRFRNSSIAEFLTRRRPRRGRAETW
jgi:serine/threonine protein phosphatase PrpC